MSPTHSCGSSAPTACTWRERWCQPIEAVTTLGRALNPSLLIVASRRGWRHHLPSERSPMFRISSEQECARACSAAAGQANDKRVVRGFPAAQCRDKAADPVPLTNVNTISVKVAAESDPPDQVKSGFTVAGLEQPRDGFEKSPLPKSSRLQRRFAVSIKSTARSGVRGIRVFSSNAPHPFRSRTGKRGRVCSRVVVEYSFDKAHWLTFCQFSRWLAIRL